MNVAVKEPVYIIIPVHNRKQITLRCLDNLSKCGDLQRYYVVVVDDGSTDGTTEAINSFYPEVNVLSGDGNLWWTGAIKKGMEYAYKQGTEYFIWLNDDCCPMPGTIPLLIRSCSKQKYTLVGGQCYEDYDSPDLTYGGQKKLLIGIKAIYAQKNAVVKCDALDGNLVCLPRYIVDDIDYPPSNKIPHYGGDTMYTWQAKKKAIVYKY